MIVGRTFFICCRIWVKRGVRDLHLVLLRVRDFRENRRREGHDLIGLNEIKLAVVSLNYSTFESAGPLMVAQWLRYCATNRKVAGSIPDGVIGIFH
jgi:hypothetical protein